MFLTRRVTRSYEELHEVELTDELRTRLTKLMEAYGEDDISLDDLTSADWQQLWNRLEELHSESGDVIVMDDDGFWAGTDDVCEYEVHTEAITGSQVYL